MLIYFENKYLNVWLIQPKIASTHCDVFNTGKNIREWSLRFCLGVPILGPLISQEFLLCVWIKLLCCRIWYLTNTQNVDVMVYGQLFFDQLRILVSVLELISSFLRNGIKWMFLPSLQILFNPFVAHWIYPNQKKIKVS